MKNGGMKSKYSQLKPASYQLVPLLKLLHNNLNSILISDGVGVGKTISAGYILLYLVSKLKQSGLVVCPPSLLIKWKEELESKFGLRAFITASDEELTTMQIELSVKIKNKIPTIYIIPSSMLTKLRLSDQTKISVIVFDFDAPKPHFPYLHLVWKALGLVVRFVFERVENWFI